VAYRVDTVWVEWQDRRRSLSDLAAEVGMPRQILYERVIRYGWSIQRALSEPVRSRRCKPRKKIAYDAVQGSRRDRGATP
jgi:hypothetical protein